jgi:hypothetical protein
MDYPNFPNLKEAHRTSPGFALVALNASRRRIGTASFGSIGFARRRAYLRASRPQVAALYRFYLALFPRRLSASPGGRRPIPTAEA